MKKNANYSNNQESNHTNGIQNYIGIPFNGDCHIYKKGVIKALVKCNDESITKAVLEAESDFEIAKILLKNHLYDILIDEFNCIDIRVCIDEYINEHYR